MVVIDKVRFSEQQRKGFVLKKSSICSFFMKNNHSKTIYTELKY
jgi:hypothetical protein